MACYRDVRSTGSVQLSGLKPVFEQVTQVSLQKINRAGCSNLEKKTQFFKNEKFSSYEYLWTPG